MHDRQVVSRAFRPVEQGSASRPPPVEQGSALHSAQVEQGPASRPLPRRPAFTLTELIVVVVIIGILAAIAIPRLSSAPSAARESALLDSLSKLRRAIELYTAEHGQVLPGVLADGQGGAALSADAFIRQLTQFSAPDGTTSPTRTGAYVLGPYLRTIPGVPVCNHQGTTTVAIDAANSPPLVTTGSEGWVYNPNTGELIANCDDACSDGTRAYDEF